MAATRLIPLHVNKGKTIAQTIFDRTEYIKNPEKTIDRVINGIVNISSVQSTRKRPRPP